MEKMFEATRFIFLLVTFSLLVIPLSFWLMISDIKEENEFVKKYNNRIV